MVAKTILQRAQEKSESYVIGAIIHDQAVCEMRDKASSLFAEGQLCIAMQTSGGAFAC